MLTVTHKHRVENVLTSYASLPTATVFQMDTEQEYLSATSMTLDSVGIYSYEFTDLGLEYQYRVDVIFDSVVKEPIVHFGATDLAYGNPTEADLYFLNHLWASAWFSLTISQKLWVLREATLRLDRLPFYSAPTALDQTKRFPRNGNATTPVVVQEASFDIALKLAEGIVPDEAVDLLHVSRESFAGVSTTFDRNNSGKPWIVSGILSHDAWTKLIPYMLNSNAIELLRA